MRRRTWVLVYLIAVVAGLGLFPQAEVLSSPTSVGAP